LRSIFAGPGGVSAVADTATEVDGAGVMEAEYEQRPGLGLA
jgi:hypothetical protein